VLIQPYIYLGAVVIVLLVLIYLKKMPTDCDTRSRKNLAVVAKELFKKRNYRQGVVAQFFYEGAQITCWMFIIQYGSRIFMAEGMDEKAAELLAQKFNIAAMVLFTVSRFICTWLLKYIAPGRLLSILAIVAVAALGGVILFTDRCGIYCLVLVSGCLSLMFPTIYGIALRGVGDNLKFASAGLIMAILGGSVFPHIQALLIDLNVTILGIPATNLSFIVPLICLIVVALYGHKSYVRHNILHQFG
jgi:FHS family L-fucose permease-like MFS transporter